MDNAKRKEWAQWCSNSVAELATLHGVPRDRVIGARWVLSWKEVDAKDVPAGSEAAARAQGGRTTVAKARLVPLGCQDPDLGLYARSSPTLSRVSRSMLCAFAAQLGWRVFTLDAKTAFLAGDLSSRSRPPYFRPPPRSLEIARLPQWRHPQTSENREWLVSVSGGRVPFYVV